MDIISLGKAKKVKEMNDRTLNKMGVDPEGESMDVAGRVAKIEALDPKAGLFPRIGEVSAHTTINLNKHNLQVGSYLNTARSEYSAMVYEGFSDASGIDMSKSTGIEYDVVRKVVKVIEGSNIGEVILNEELTNDPPVFVTVSIASDEDRLSENKITLEDEDQGDVLIENGVISLNKDVLGNVAKEGLFESSIIDMGDNFKKLYRLRTIEVNQGGTLIEWYTATSSDGVTFEEYMPLNMDGTIASTSGRYVKLKAILKSDGQMVQRAVYEFNISEELEFEASEFISLDGSLKLKTLYEQEMEVDENYVGEGTLIKTVIDRSKLKTIEGLEVR